MRKTLLLCAAILCLSMTAAAQDVTASLDSTSPAAEPPAPFHVENRAPWQLGMGYQYQHFKPLGQTIHTNGFNVDITRFLNDWIGVEAAAIMGFGSTNTTPSAKAKSLFIGGGLHAAINEHGRFEPWIHGLVGLEHFRTAPSNSGLGFMGGGGVDFKIGPSLYLRAQGDFIGTRINSLMQSGYSFGTGVVLNF
jgi:Outer membrane protein beta-barrel domain